MSPPHLITALLLLPLAAVCGMDILSKFQLESCELTTASAPLNCREKLVVGMAVSSHVSGGVDSLLVNFTKVGANGTEAITIRDPPVITVRKSEVYIVYALTYINDVNAKPEEKYVDTHKCEPDAGADVVKYCERLWTENGTIIAYTEPVCCPCEDHRAPTSCSNKIVSLLRGKRNTAHCVRFTGDWFHVFQLKTWSIWFNISVQVKNDSSVSA